MESQNSAVRKDSLPVRPENGEGQRTEKPVEVTQLAGDSGNPRTWDSWF